MNPFVFEYVCDGCAQPVCERQQLMCLTLGHDEALWCLACLALHEALPIEAVRQTTRRYIQARDCFRKPWTHVDPTHCPRIATGQCPCQSDPAVGWRSSASST